MTTSGNGWFFRCTFPTATTIDHPLSSDFFLCITLLMHKHSNSFAYSLPFLLSSFALFLSTCERWKTHCTGLHYSFRETLVVGTGEPLSGTHATTPTIHRGHKAHTYNTREKQGSTGLGFGGKRNFSRYRRLQRKTNYHFGRKIG